MVFRPTQRAGAAVLAAGIAAAALMSATATAQETIKLTFITGFPPPTTFVGAAVDVYIPAIDATLAKSGKYKIAWNLAHSGQVVKPRGEPEGIELGLGDFGDVTTPFHLDKVPLYTLAYVTPFTTTDTGLQVEAHKKLAAAFPEFEQSWRALNQTPVSITSVVDNYFVLSSTPIKRLADLKGKKIGAAGPNLPWVTPTGAAGVQTDLTAGYNALQTGIYSGIIIWAQVAGAFKLCEPAPHILQTDFGSASIHAMNFNLDVWDGLPEEVRAAFRANADVWNKEQLKRLKAGAQWGLDRCEKNFGATQSHLSAADRKAWAMGLPPLALNWAKIDGRPGSAGQQDPRHVHERDAGRQPAADPPVG